MNPQNGYAQSGYAQQQSRLPYRTDVWDEQTINPQLPQGNDVFPPIQNLPISIHPDNVGMVVGQFRAMIQQRVGATPVHTFAYNVFSDGYFNNEQFILWTQRLMDFIDLLIIGAGKPMQVAVDKAIGMIYRGALAQFASDFPELFQMMSPRGQHDLVDAGKAIDQVMQDIEHFVNNGRRPPQSQQPMGQTSYVQGGGGGYGQRPMHVNPVQAGVGLQGGGARIGGQSQGHRVGSQVTAPPAGGRYNQTWDAREPVVKEREAPSASYTAPPVVDDGFDAIKSKDELIFDPHAYVPQGVEIDEKRPYDVIYAPGGVEARPYHLSPWTRSKSDTAPYSTIYDPTQYCLYHVHWPDGLVEEQLVEWTTEMDYLKHEINEKLRGAKVKPDGKIVASHVNLLSRNEEPVPIETLIPEGDNHLNPDDLKPVILDGLIAGSSRMESEMAARQQIIDTLKLDPDTKELPAHEYVSVQVHPIEIDKEGWERLIALSDAESLPAVARGMNEALNDGVMPLRVYRLLNARLTRAINVCLQDNLAMPEIAIQSFVEDMQELYDYLRSTKQMPEMVEAFVSRTRPLLRRVLNLREEEIEDEDEPRTERFLVEEYINMQLSWSHEELGSLNLSKEAGLISQASHPRVHKVVSDLIRRHAKDKTLDGRYVQLITSDGIYLEVVTGWLVEKSLLLKYAD